MLVGNNNNNSSKMEPTFYDENAYSQPNPRDTLKRNMSLDLNVRRMRMNSLGLAAPPVLSSPELNMLKLSSPELEKLIIEQQNAFANGGNPAQLQALFPRNVTEEQEIYAQGFVEALNELHHSDSSQGGYPQQNEAMTTGANNARLLVTPSPPNQNVHNTYNPNVNSQFFQDHHHHHHHHHQQQLQQQQYHLMTRGGYPSTISPPIAIKDEPQIVPESSEPVSPLDLECQEKIKLERKRYRNRVAASKCRKRKLERIASLEAKVRALKNENAGLEQVAINLKDQVYRLKDQVILHINNGCRIVLPQHQHNQ